MSDPEDAHCVIGAELPIGKDIPVIGLAVFIFIAIRIGIESIAAMHYPERLEAVRHDGKLEPPTWHAPLSLMIQVAVFVFVALAFVGAVWTLVIGAALFFAPAVTQISVRSSQRATSPPNGRRRHS